MPSKKIERAGSKSSQLVLFFNVLLVVIVTTYFIANKFAGGDDFTIPNFGDIQYTTGNRSISFTQPADLYIREESVGDSSSIFFYISEQDLDESVQCTDDQSPECERAIAELHYDVLPRSSFLTIEEEKNRDLKLRGELSGVYTVYQDEHGRSWGVRDQFLVCTQDTSDICQTDVDYTVGDIIHDFSFFSQFHVRDHNTKYDHERFWQHMVTTIEFL